MYGIQPRCTDIQWTIRTDPILAFDHSEKRYYIRNDLNLKGRVG